MGRPRPIPKAKPGVQTLRVVAKLNDAPYIWVAWKDSKQWTRWHVHSNETGRTLCGQYPAGTITRALIDGRRSDMCGHCKWRVHRTIIVLGTAVGSDVFRGFPL